MDDDSAFACRMPELLGNRIERHRRWPAQVTAQPQNDGTRSNSSLSHSMNSEIRLSRRLCGRT